MGSCGPSHCPSSLPLPPAPLPSPRRLQVWTGIATVAAALSGFLIPWEVAFEPPGQLYDPSNPVVAAEALLLGIFGLDMLLSFRTAFFQGDAVVSRGSSGGPRVRSLRKLAERSREAVMRAAETEAA